jgi:hypothetical protein
MVCKIVNQCTVPVAAINIFFSNCVLEYFLICENIIFRWVSSKIINRNKQKLKNNLSIKN